MMCGKDGFSGAVDISAGDFFDRMVAGLDDPDVVVVDIRTADEFEVYHLTGALNIDFYKDDFADRLDALDRNKTYLIYCRTGRRTGTADDNARDLMVRMGFSRVFNMLGGIHKFVDVAGADDYLE